MNPQLPGEEWKRTQPDLVVYRPTRFGESDNENEHLLVARTPRGDLLAFWMSATREDSLDERIVCARSADDGRTWSAPQWLDGPRGGDGLIASRAFPIYSRSGRIYCFYNKSVGLIDNSRGMTAVMRCLYSDDDGYTWKPGGDIPFRRTKIDHPDPRVPCNWFAWQPPIRDAQGRWVTGFTRRASPTYLADCLRRPPGLTSNWGHWAWFESQCELMRFENLDEGPDPQQLQITFLPDDPHCLRVPLPDQPLVSYAHEPTIALLPDGRLFLVMRTWTGRIYYSVSSDNGHTWRPPQVLRQRDGGAEMLQPKSGSPLYRMKDGRYLLFYHHNDGTANGGTGPGDYLRNRWPLYVALGEYRPAAQQPVWFSPPQVFATTDGIPKPPVDPQGDTALTEVGDYTSFTEDHAGRVLWYPDRKHFLLGKYIADDLLSNLHVPA
jgi:hypothetical protein